MLWLYLEFECEELRNTNSRILIIEIDCHLILSLVISEMKGEEGVLKFKYLFKTYGVYNCLFKCTQFS